MGVRRGPELAIGGLVKVKAGSGVRTYRMKDTLVRPNEEKISQKWVRRGLIELVCICRIYVFPCIQTEHACFQALGFPYSPL